MSNDDTHCIHIYIFVVSAFLSTIVVLRSKLIKIGKGGAKESSLSREGRDYIFKAV